METYYGHVRTPADAIVLFEACRLGLLPRVQRRLSEKERQQIRSGSVFVWDEREAGMRRWTDGKSWSASRVAGSFLNYREMEGKRGNSNSYNSPMMQGVKQPPPPPPPEQDFDGEGGSSEGYRYKPDGLVKQSFSITTNQGQHLHLISYHARSDPHAPRLSQPSSDPQLRHIHPAKGMYPDASVQGDGSALPAVTRSPMVGPYAGSPQSVHGGYPSHQRHPPPAYAPSYGNWPPSPLNTPPSGHYSHYPPPQHHHHQPAANGQSPGYFAQPPYPHHQRALHPGPTAFDKAPPSLTNGGIPPPPPHAAPHPHYAHGSPPPPPSYDSRGPPAPYYSTASIPRPSESSYRSSPPSQSSMAPVPPPLQSPPTQHATSGGTIPSISSLVMRSPPRSTASYSALPPHYAPNGSAPIPPMRSSPPGGDRQALGGDKAVYQEDVKALRQLDRHFTSKT